MAITKRFEYKEEILPNQVIQIRTTTVVEEDGVELARNHHRHVVAPGQDVSNEIAEVQANRNDVISLSASPSVRYHVRQGEAFCGVNFCTPISDCDNLHVGIDTAASFREQSVGYSRHVVCVYL